MLTETENHNSVRPMMIALVGLAVMIGVHIVYLQDRPRALLAVNFAVGVIVCGYATWTLAAWLWSELSGSRQAFWLALLATFFVLTYGSLEVLAGWDTEWRRLGVTCIFGFGLYGLILANMEHHGAVVARRRSRVPSS